MSAWQAVGVGEHGGHVLLHAGRRGAGDESTRSNVAGPGKENHVGASGRDDGDQRPADAALARALGRVRGPGLVGPAGGKPSPKRVPVAVGEKVLGRYREKYFDLHVRHLHEKLPAEHPVEISYRWGKGILQGAGRVAKGRKRGGHRQRRPRRPWPGMLRPSEGSEQRWFQDERWYDLLVIRDEANSEIY